MTWHRDPRQIEQMSKARKKEHQAKITSKNFENLVEHERVEAQKPKTLLQILKSLIP